MTGILFFRIATSLLVATYLAWEDARTSFMNEKLLYAFAAGGFLFDLIFLPLSSWLYVFGLAVVFGLFGFWSYKTGQFGGGDVLLLLGLHLWLPSSPFVQLQWPFVFSVLLASASFASIGSAGLYAWKLREFKLSTRKKIIFSLLTLAGVAVLFWLPMSFGLLLFLFILLESALFYFIFRQEILAKVVIKQLSVKQIEDEDILAAELLPQQDVKKFGLERVLTQNALAKLKKYLFVRRKKTAPVYKDLPRFGPYLLAGLIACLLVGDVVWFLLFA